MFIRKIARQILVIGFLTAAATASAQDSAALVNALIRKGILTNQEAEDIRADLIQESNTVPAHAIALNKSTDRLNIGMRMHIQYANLGTEIQGTPTNPVYTDHFFLRRMYLTLRAGLGANWDAIVTFDVAGQSYDDANIGWHPNNDLDFYFGLRKVNNCYEERLSSGNIKAIERSSVTRYFVESNNGRRLGAGSYRIGAFMVGKRDLTNTFTLNYTGAVTSPERNETWTGSAAFGDNTTNHVAFWGTAGFTQKLANGSLIAGVGSAFLPDQGGFGTANLGRGFGLTEYTAYADLTAGPFSFLGEYLTADVDHGRGTPGNADARPRGFFLQPSIMLTDTIEAVVRYSWLDSDQRGVNLSDVVRSAPGGGTMNKFTEWYAGANWYLKGNDLKYQLGAVYGKTKDTLTGAPASARTVGVRSQLQMQF